MKSIDFVRWKKHFNSQIGNYDKVCRSLTSTILIDKIYYVEKQIFLIILSQKTISTRRECFEAPAYVEMIIEEE